MGVAIIMTSRSFGHAQILLRYHSPGESILLRSIRGNGAWARHQRFLGRLGVVPSIRYGFEFVLTLPHELGCNWEGGCAWSCVFV